MPALFSFRPFSFDFDFSHLALADDPMDGESLEAGGSGMSTSNGMSHGLFF